MSVPYQLFPASQVDVVELMSWFPNAAATAMWGGPGFRYPFDKQSFLEDTRCGEIASYCLKDREQLLIGFGQYYERLGRINLARLVVVADRRGQGLGAELISRLMEQAAIDLPLQQFSLFVYRDNSMAYDCYHKLGFRKVQYPEGAPLADACYYMTRDVDRI